MGRTRRLTSVAKSALPRAMWSTVAHRLASDQSLRGSAREYGVSHETVRRAARADHGDVQYTPPESDHYAESGMLTRALTLGQ